MRCEAGERAEGGGMGAENRKNVKGGDTMNKGQNKAGGRCNGQGRKGNPAGQGRCQGGSGKCRTGTGQGRGQGCGQGRNSQGR
jgi:hypothetical protein